MYYLTEFINTIAFVAVVKHWFDQKNIQQARGFQTFF